MPGICNPVAAGRHHLTDEEVGAFLARARRLGHDPARLLAGEVTETLTSIPALEQARQLSQVSPAERRARQAVFFHPAIAIRSRLGQGVHDRCEAYVFADGSIDDADRDRLAMRLPFPARLLSVLYRRVAAAEVWDLTMEPRVLGIDERDDLFNVVNVGELVIEPGGRVIVQGNLLVLGCQHLRHPAHSPGSRGLPARRPADAALGGPPGRPAARPGRRAGRPRGTRPGGDTSGRHADDDRRCPQRAAGRPDERGRRERRRAGRRRRTRPHRAAPPRPPRSPSAA